MISSTFELNVCHEVSLKFYKGKLRILVRKLSCGTCMYKKLWEKMLFRLQAHIFFSLYSIWQKKALKSFLLSFKGWSLSQTFRIRYFKDLSNWETNILIYIRIHHVFVSTYIILKADIRDDIYIYGLKMVWSDTQ